MGRVQRTSRRQGGGRRSGGEGKRSDSNTTQPGGLSGGFHSSRTSAVSGQEDAQYSLLRWEFVYLVNIPASTSLGFCIKGNSAYQPGNIATVGLGATSAPSGYARQFTQYSRGLVSSAKLSVSAWGNALTSSTVSTYRVPLVIGIVPAGAATAITYASALPAIAMSTVPHGKCVTQYPGTTRTVTSAANSASLLYGDSKETLTEQFGGGSNTFASATDPTTAWYFVVGVSNIDNPLLTPSAVSCSVRVIAEYRIKWFRPEATATLTIPRDRFGMELASGCVDEYKIVLPIPAGAGIRIFPGLQKEEQNTTAETKDRPCKLKGEELIDYDDFESVKSKSDPFWEEWLEYKRAQVVKAADKTPVFKSAGAGLGGLPPKPG